MEPDERGLLPGEPDPREPSCVYPGCGLPEFVHGKSGHPFRALRPSVEPLDVERLARAMRRLALPDAGSWDDNIPENRVEWIKKAAPLVRADAADRALLPTQASDSPDDTEGAG